MTDPNARAWAILLIVGGLGALLLLDALRRYLFPPRCETCGRRYDHHAHEDCPYCVPPRRLIAPWHYTLPLLIFGGFAALGMAIHDAAIVGISWGAFLLIVLAGVLRVPWEELLTARMAVLLIVCSTVALFIAENTAQLWAR